MMLIAPVLLVAAVVLVPAVIDVVLVRRRRPRPAEPTASGPPRRPVLRRSAAWAFVLVTSAAIASVWSAASYQPDNALFGSVSLAFPRADDATLDSYEPFRPYELAPHDRIRLALILDLRYCTGPTAAPTLAPGETPGRSFVQFEGGKLGFGAFKINWSALGIGHTTDLDLPAGLTLSWAGDRYGCDPPGAFPSPELASP